MTDQKGFRPGRSLRGRSPTSVKGAKVGPKGTSKHKGPGRSATSPAALDAAERHARWMQSRIAGKSYRAIAAEEGVTPAAVHEAVTRRLRETLTEPATELRELEVARTEELYAATQEKVAKGDSFAIQTAVRVLESKRKLLGIDAPTKTMDVTPPREELWARIKAWLEAPTPELEQVLAETGWKRG
jgi:hypothetical protein